MHCSWLLLKEMTKSCSSLQVRYSNEARYIRDKFVCYMLQIKLTFMTYFTWKWVRRNTIIGDAGHEQKECDSFGVLVNIHVVQWISITNENSKTVMISMVHFYLPFLSKFRWQQGFLETGKDFNTIILYSCFKWSLCQWHRRVLSLFIHLLEFRCH